MIKRTVILPLRDNAGASLARELAECERELTAIAGGFTRLASRGVWRDDSGRIYRDRSRAYWAILEPAQDAELLAILPYWARRLRQLAIYSDATAADVTFAAPE